MRCADGGEDRNEVEDVREVLGTETRNLVTEIVLGEIVGGFLRRSIRISAGDKRRFKGVTYETSSGKPATRRRVRNDATTQRGG